MGIIYTSGTTGNPKAVLGFDDSDGFDTFKWAF